MSRRAKSNVEGNIFKITGNTLKQSLGHLTKHPDMEWQYHFDPVTSTLQDRFNKTIASLETSSGRDHRFVLWQPAPSSTVWTFYPVDPPVVTTTQVKVHQLPTEPSDFNNFGQPIDSFRSHVRSLPYYCQQLVNGVMTEASAAEIFTALCSRKPIYIISDGGLKDKRITYG